MSKPPDLFKFWNELKRRKVVKASLVYLAVAFTILQASESVFPRLNLPDWTITFVLILLIIVFILVIVLTWVYDITPEGIKVTEDKKQDEEQIEINPEKDSGPVYYEAVNSAAADEIELQQKVRVLEDQLREARKYPFKTLLKISFRKLAFPVLLLALIIVLVVKKQSIVRIMGFGNAKRETAMVHNANAAIYIERGQFGDAKRELELALESDPGYSYAWGNMAVVSYRLGDPDKAVVQTIKAMNLDPGNSKAPYNLAFALHDKKDFKQAVRWYKEAIRIDSTSKADSVYTASCSALGSLYNSLDQPVDALLILNRALDQFPASRYRYLIYKNLGNAYLLQEQTDSALKYLELSINLHPDEPETNLFLARAYEAEGLSTKSIDQWEKYIGLETDTLKISEARKHLKEITIRHLQEIIK